MTTISIPPEGVPAELSFDIPAPGGMSTLGGVRVYLNFSEGGPQGYFSLSLDVNGVQRDVAQSGSGPSSLTYICQFQEALKAPARATVTLNQWSHLDPGAAMTVYAWGAQTESGSGVLNPDEGGESSLMTATIEAGSVEVLDWPEWNRLTGANEGAPADGP